MLEKGLFCNFKTNIEYISIDVNSSKVITLEPLIMSDKISSNFIFFK